MGFGGSRPAVLRGAAAASLRLQRPAISVATGCNHLPGRQLDGFLEAVEAGGYAERDCALDNYQPFAEHEAQPLGLQGVWCSRGVSMAPQLRLKAWQPDLGEG
eukprot:CAMPEP_0117676712 /NCGR_PEP_ID=MMETSP0804-20121206/16346_1 /TAXON_ID=1074897 /ORGANISM="Tetraselmis astigmatica, Strain CCMP880" /LENGTH=102 /DNA_ID=CAMNT_0005485923 /DNA_START=82 /DNA_END=388 /DNA_ORIENTATION=-